MDLDLGSAQTIVFSDGTVIELLDRPPLRATAQEAIASKKEPHAAVRQTLSGWCTLLRYGDL
jgi:hypothetical protein